MSATWSSMKTQSERVALFLEALHTTSRAEPAQINICNIVFSSMEITDVFNGLVRRSLSPWLKPLTTLTHRQGHVPLYNFSEIPSYLGEAEWQVFNHLRVHDRTLTRSVISGLHGNIYVTCRVGALLLCVLHRSKRAEVETPCFAILWLRVPLEKEHSCHTSKGK